MIRVTINTRGAVSVPFRIIIHLIFTSFSQNQHIPQVTGQVPRALPPSGGRLSPRGATPGGGGDLLLTATPQRAAHALLRLSPLIRPSDQLYPGNFISSMNYNSVLV